MNLNLREPREDEDSLSKAEKEELARLRKENNDLKTGASPGRSRAGPGASRDARQGWARPARFEQYATVAVTLILVLAMIGLAAYEIVHDPNGDITKGLIGALTLAFGNAIAHLFGSVGAPPAKPQRRAAVTLCPPLPSRTGGIYGDEAAGIAHRPLLPRPIGHA